MILQVNKMYHPDIGGVETVVKQYSEYLSQYDEVIVLCINKNFSLTTKKETINGIKIYRCASFGTYMSMPVSIVFFFYLFFLSRKADVVHFHEPFPLGSLCSIVVPQNKKVFITWHSDIIKQKKIKKVFEYFQSKLCKKAKVIIATSERLAKFSNILKKYSEKVKIVPLSINKDDYFDSNTLLFNPSLPENYVLYIGRFSYYKGIFVLLDAIDLIDEDIPFVIAGDGELKEKIKERLHKSKKNIILIDRFLTEQEKKYLLKNAKFLVFPSTYPSEAFGIVQLEAMVYGKPVINTRLPTGVPWVSLHGESGLTTEPFDVKGLAKAIKTLYFDENLYKKLGKGAKERFEKYFSYETVTNALSMLYFQD